MKGQWIGTYAGATNGMIIVNIDELKSNFQGVAYLNEADKRIPSVAVSFQTNNKDDNFQFRTGLIMPINPTSGLVDTWDNVKHYYSDDAFVSNYADVVGSCEGDFLSMTWTSEKGVEGNCKLPRSIADKPSELVALDRDWESYLNP